MHDIKTPFKIFIGYDEREQDAFNVYSYSIYKHASIPIEIIRLDRSKLIKAGIYNRKESDENTQFTYTRFLVPFLCKYKGHALFADCDMIMTTDIKELVEQIDDKYAVQVVQHPHYIPKHNIKMWGKQQNNEYPRKNWSSFILFNCSHNYLRQINPTVVNNERPEYLHRFSYLNDRYIGALHRSWNFLCDEELDKPSDGSLPKNIHYTNFGPWFSDRPECINCEYSEVWQQYKKEYDEYKMSEAFPLLKIESLDNSIKLDRESKPRLTIKELSDKKKKRECIPCRKR